MRFRASLSSTLLLLNVGWVTALQYAGADFSSLITLENSGIRYSDGGSSQAFETILANHGLNVARIRIWTAGDYTLDYSLNLARRAAAAEMAIMVDFHYSDTWADPGKQAIPSSWPTDLDGLNTKIYTYTHDTLAEFVNQGIPVNFVQLGNEINNGMLWPTGQVSENGYDGLSQLLHSAANGSRDAAPNARRIVHLANGWNSGGVSSFFQQIFRPGQFAEEDVDVLGFSFYPFYDSGATLSALRSSLSNIVSTYGKDVMVVETDWPVSCPGRSLTEPSISISAEGQSQWMSQIVSVLEGLSGGHGIGVVYWEPGWIGNANLGSACADNILVNGDGSVRSSINMFADAR